MFSAQRGFQMVRRWVVRPDPEWGVVDRQDVVQAIMDGEAMLARAGGHLLVSTFRAPTDVEHEMVTTHVVVEWKDRTDAKPQPEPHTTAGMPERPSEPELVDPTPEELEAALEAQDAGPSQEEVDAAYDERDGVKLEEEDLSSIPVEMR